MLIKQKGIYGILRFCNATHSVCYRSLQTVTTRSDVHSCPESSTAGKLHCYTILVQRGSNLFQCDPAQHQVVHHEDIACSSGLHTALTSTSLNIFGMKRFNARLTVMLNVMKRKTDLNNTLARVIQDTKEIRYKDPVQSLAWQLKANLVKSLLKADWLTTAMFVLFFLQ